VIYSLFCKKKTIILKEKKTCSRVVIDTMFENIERARSLLKSGSIRNAVDEFFKIIKDLKSKKNHDEAARLLIEIAKAVENSHDSRLIAQSAERFIEASLDLKVKDKAKFFEEAEKFLVNAKPHFQEKDQRSDILGKISETIGGYYKLRKKDNKEILIEAADHYSNWAHKNLSRSRLREEDIAIGEEYLLKANTLYSEAKSDEKMYQIYENLVATFLEQKNEERAQAVLDQAMDALIQMKADKKTILGATEIVMNSYVKFIEFKIADLLNPEFQITKPETIIFDNNVAVRIIRHAKDICENRKAIPAITILAKELVLIGLALFEKKMQQYAIPYFNTAKDYYLLVGNNEETINFGNSVISIGLQLYTDEKYPLGRDYFNIAIEIGQQIDRVFEAQVYEKQADLFLKYNKFQLAFEAYRLMIVPLKALPESEMRIDIPSQIRQLARDRFNKNDFHYAEIMYRLTADFFLEFDQLELAADTYDAAWAQMFQVRQLQTGIDLATKAAEAYIKAGKEDDAADVYIRLAEELLSESHFDIALERLNLAAEAIPEFLQESKFVPLVQLTTKYSEQCLKSGDIINARELWSAACKFNETLSRALIKRDIDAAVEVIEEHIKNVRKFENDELNSVTMESARGSGRVLSEAGENERAAKIMVSFATDFLRKNLTEFAEPLFEEGAIEFNKAQQPDEASRILTALARYHAENSNYEKSLTYYLKASIESGVASSAKIYQAVAEHCFESFTTVLNKEEIIDAEKGFELAVKIDEQVNKIAAANRAYEIAKRFYDRNQFELSCKYYKKSINGYFDSSLKHAIIISAEIIERGRDLFQRKIFIEASQLIELGFDTLYNAEQKVQAAQTARIEGERFLSSSIPETGITFLAKATTYFIELKDKQSSAEIATTLGNFYINSNMIQNSLENFVNAGDIFIEIKRKNDLNKLISRLQEIAIGIVIQEISSQTEGETKRDEMAEKFFHTAELFALKIKDKKLDSEIKYREWLTFSKELLHEYSLKALDKTFKSYTAMKGLAQITALATEVSEFSAKLIRDGDLANATEYLNKTIKVLQEIHRFDTAAGLCVNTCEVFLSVENNEVAVSWGLRAAEILTKHKKSNEAIGFLEELAEQLMKINSIENAILCFGKIAKIQKEAGEVDEVKNTAQKVMAYGTAHMKSNNPEAGLRLWEVALTIGTIVGEEFTGRLCLIEGQTFYEIKNYEKSIELFKEAFGLFRRVKKNNRLIGLGNTVFGISEELQRNLQLDIAFKFLPIAFESISAGDELFLGCEKLIHHAKNYIEMDRVKEGNHLINTAIDALFSKREVANGIEKCFVGAALLISYGKGTEGGRLLDKGMEKISQINDEAAIKHLATVCRNQGIILRDDGRLEASHIILASGIGILRTINDLTGIGQISIDLGKTLIARNEMSAAVEAYRNGVQLIAQGGLTKEAGDVVNELITEGRKQIDHDNINVGMPLVDLAGELFLILGYPERIMMISEIFINQGGKMINERNFEIAALYFSKSMELSTQAGLNDYLPKVGNRCIDFGLKMVKEGDSILGIQFMNAGAETIITFEGKRERASRASANYLEAITEILSSKYEKTIEDEGERMELIGQFVDSTNRFFAQIDDTEALENLANILIEHGKKLLRTKEPNIVRRILEPALRSAEFARNTKLQIKIANIYLDHVSYLSDKGIFELLDPTIDQALNIYLEVNDPKEIRKFMGILAQTARELAIKLNSRQHGIKIFNSLADLTCKLQVPEIYPVVVVPSVQLNDQALELEDYDLMIFARQTILRLLNNIQDANLNLSLLGNLKLSEMIPQWHKVIEPLLLKQEAFDSVIKIIDQALQLAVIIQEIPIGQIIIEKTMLDIDIFEKKKFKGIDTLYEVLAVAMKGLNQNTKIIEIGQRCLQIGKDYANRKKLRESIDYLKVAGRIYALVEDARLIAEVAIACASIGDQQLKENNHREGLYYYSAALENYELSKDEKSIQIIATTIEKLFVSTPLEDGYICFLVPGMVYANRENITKAEELAKMAITEAEKMIKSGKKDLALHSIPYIFAAADIYEKTGNFSEETKLYDIFMFKYLEAVSDSKILNLFIDLMIRTILKKLLVWDFRSIELLFQQVSDNRVLRNKKYQALTNAMKDFKEGSIASAVVHAANVNSLYQRSIRGFVEMFKKQVKDDITKKGIISIHEYMEEQNISHLINVLIQDLFARKEIEGKYFQIGLFVSSKSLDNTLNFTDKELTEKGKATITDIAKHASLKEDEVISILRREYIPQKLQATFNENNTYIYSYLQLRSEVAQLALGYQEIGNIDINKISQQLLFPPETIQREIEYLILEGKVSPRMVGRK